MLTAVALCLGGGCLLRGGAVILQFRSGTCWTFTAEPEDSPLAARSYSIHVSDVLQQRGGQS